MRRGCGRGFTIVEVLVVIGILGLLLGLLLPALAGVQKKGRKSRELNALRQVGMAWVLYANASNDRTLPGFLGPGVQQRWKVTYEFFNRNLIPPAPIFGAGVPNIAGPWTFRLLPYMDHSHDMVHGYHEEEIDPFAAVAEAQSIAFQPGFGYNAYYVGGWWEMMSSGPSATPGLPRYLYHNATVEQDDGAMKRTQVVSTSVASINRSSDLVIFASSSRLGAGLYRKWPDNMAGSHYVVPPIVGTTLQWVIGESAGEGPPIGGSGSAGIDAQGETPHVAGHPGLIAGGADPTTVQVVGAAPHEMDQGEQFTGAPIGRYNRLIATLYADGHTGANTPGALLDMQRWIDVADKRDFTHQ